MNKLILNVIFLLVLLLILIYYLKTEKVLEGFRTVFGTDSLVNLGNCRPENNCFLGSYARTQIYQNVCQPKTGLLRQKIPLSDDCQRSFSDYLETPKYHYICKLDKHLGRKCKWIKKTNV